MLNDLDVMDLDTLQNNFSIGHDEVTYHPVTQCPMCHNGVVPHVLGAATVRPHAQKKLYVWQYCPACHEVFTSYHFRRSDDDVFHYEESVPTLRKPLTVEPELSQISPNFVEIYSEAMFAYQEGFHNIAGMGLRKALEFLVKDFLISRDPDNRHKIERYNAIDAIRQLPNEELKTLAERIEWLGNDETHYVRLHTEVDTNMIYRLTEALRYYIVSAYRVHEAEQIAYIKPEKLKPAKK